jgi:hypothetical protein
MKINWVQAYGEHQLPFMGAASRALRGDWAPCPKCSAKLRGYFHVFKPETGTGSFWLWCAACGTYTTLPRVKPVVAFVDPFSDVARGDFGALETSADEPFLDRLERMWSDRTLGLGHAASR